ncbi:unnamed protein product [Schistosoma curassoni]|uniref:Uncharacterized protein n=1 Tax=Schistosoma curassoni TaxID=6186 RepID=A0A183K1F6_9TREM|nr:unnamed protein product [Schistosoma curassoni]
MQLCINIINTKLLMLKLIHQLVFTCYSDNCPSHNSNQTNKNEPNKRRNDVNFFFWPVSVQYSFVNSTSSIWMYINIFLFY